MSKKDLAGAALLVEIAEKKYGVGKCWLSDPAEPAWREEDHPDIAEAGSAACEPKLRRERSARQDHLDEIASEAQK